MVPPIDTDDKKADNGGSPQHVPSMHQVVAFLDDVDETDHSNSQNNGSESSLHNQFIAPSTPPTTSAPKVGFVSPSPSAWHSSVNSVESMVLLESDEESVEEKERTDRRTADLLLRRSSSRRLGEMFVVEPDESESSSSSGSSARVSSSGNAGNASDDEQSSTCSSGGYQEPPEDSTHDNHSADELYLKAQAFLKSTIQLQALVRGYCTRRRHPQRPQKTAPKTPPRRNVPTDPLSVQAAVRITSLVRGYLARRAYRRLMTYLEMQLAALVIQKWWMAVAMQRQRQQPKSPSSYALHHHGAARCIQALFRGWATREFFALQRFAAALIQAQVRGHQARVAYAQRLLQSKALLPPPLVPATEVVKSNVAAVEHNDDSFSSSTSSSMPAQDDDLPPISATVPKSSTPVRDDSSSSAAPDQALTTSIKAVDKTAVRDDSSWSPNALDHSNASSGGKDEISMPPLEDMEAPSESYNTGGDASSSSSVAEQSEFSVGGDSAQETIKISNVDKDKQTQQPIDGGTLTKDIVWEPSVAEATAAGTTRSMAPLLETLPGSAATTPVRGNTNNSKQLEFTRLKPPNRTAPPSMPPPPPPMPPPPRENNYNRDVQSPPTKESFVVVPTTPRSSEEILPPSPAKTEVEDELDEYLEFAEKKEKKTVSSLITLLLVVACFVLPLFVLFDKPVISKSPETTTRSKKSRPAGKPTIETIAEVISPVALAPEPSPRMEMPMLMGPEKRMNLPLPRTTETKPAMTMETRPVMAMETKPVLTMQTKPVLTMETRQGHPLPMTAPADPPRNTEKMQRRKPAPPPVDDSIVEPVPIVNIFMPSSDAVHGIQIGERLPADAPDKQKVPLASIFMPTDGAFYGTQIGEREMALARSVSNEIQIPPVGQWVKSMRERIFETSTVLQTRIEVTGWLEMDGRGLFNKRLEPDETAVGLPKDPFMEEESVKVAKDAHLSLLTEWGLSVSTRKKK